MEAFQTDKCHFGASTSECDKDTEVVGVGRGVGNFK